ncbi:serine/threonine-protein kinase [Nostoc sp. CMAA1605]|uniref:serine/threonine-protein kinase n=1 Tax=Nostoc sp. CMAA1605 TaxID=2055159 RepID=UPI001F45D83E|nr:serine/threonine-protein kinase [Nostoc sp. CMAA1605]MCF4965991.1 serine/threonine protein kinase [Nostoc sp. CMAA1605]
METLLENRYRVVQTLGSGGFGETFLAEDTQMPSNRRCVVKLLKPIHNNPQIYQLVQERFQREAAILEELGSYTDQIPTLYAYFQSNEQFYLIQEWIEGSTLTNKFYQQGVFSEESVQEILVNLLPVLEYVHSRHIIHRDIKPDNIIVRHRDGKPVLIDFGAVRESMGTVVNSQGNPTSSIVIGTPGYMPSEQAAGRPMYSSDIYSLGMTAIYLLTGKQPHELETDSRTGEIIWRTHALNVSPTFADALDRAIAYHPRERFATAREMLEALQLGAVSLPPTVYQQSQPPTTPYQQPQPATTPYQQSQPPTNPYQQQQVVTVPPSVTASNTVAVSPASSPSPEPVSKKNSSRGILLGSLIAGGLVSVSVLIGFAITRPNQSVTPSTISSSESTTNNNSTPSVEPTDTPATSNTTTTQGTTETATTPDSNSSAVTNSPVTASTPETAEPVGSQPTNAELQAGNTSSANSQTSQVETQSPEQAIENYYAHINQAQYETAWNLLTPSFQNSNLHPNGYRSYSDWWQGQVESVSVDNVSLVESDTSTATVDARLTFFMKSGQQTPAAIRFSLLRDAATNEWLINSAK